MKNLNKQEGITLVALIITVIVLLILAGITINLTIGEGGIIKRAEEAGKNYTNAADYERYLLSNLTQEMDSIIDSGVSDDTTNGSVAQRRDFSIQTPYVGTTSMTVKVDTNTIEGNIKKYIYVVGEEVLESFDTETTIENLPANSNLSITVIAVTDTNEHLISSIKIKTEPRTYLYNNGDQCIQITGGWKAGNRKFTAEATELVPTLTFNQDNMQIYLKSFSKYQGGSIEINKNIDNSIYKNICITYTATLGRYNSGTSIGFVKEKNGEAVEEYLCYQNAVPNKTTKKINISQIDDFYIHIQSYAGDGAANCNIYEVWLEK